MPRIQSKANCYIGPKIAVHFFFRLIRDQIFQAKKFFDMLSDPNQLLLEKKIFGQKPAPELVWKEKLDRDFGPL